MVVAASVLFVVCKPVGPSCCITESKMESRLRYAVIETFCKSVSPSLYCVRHTWEAGTGRRNGRNRPFAKPGPLEHKRLVKRREGGRVSLCIGEKLHSLPGAVDANGCRHAQRLVYSRVLRISGLLMPPRDLAHSLSWALWIRWRASGLIQTAIGPESQDGPSYRQRQQPGHRLALSVPRIAQISHKALEQCGRARRICQTDSQVDCLKIPKSP